MPTYEYLCERCGQGFEKFQKLSDSPVKECPRCGGGVRRLIGRGAGIIFKGSGFYSTDYRKAPSGRQSPGGGRTCCGRDEPCDRPPRSDDGTCKR